MKAYVLRQEFPEAMRNVAAGVDEKGDRISLADATHAQAEQLKLSSERFPHLFGGCEYYVPVVFDPPLRLKDPTKDPEALFGNRTTVCSTNRLMEELLELNETLKLEARWDTSKRGVDRPPSQDPDLEPIQAGWMRLEGFARVSLEHRVPICFDF